MPRNFNAAELDEMQVDWQRTHNVKIVAELHGCTQPEVVQALGLDPAKYAKSSGRTWEKNTRTKPLRSVRWWTAA